MAQLVLPDNSSDEATYTGLRDLASITSSNAEIDANPLFQLAESFIVEHLPDAALTATGRNTGRDYPQRPIVLSALQFLAAANLLRGGGSVGGETVVEGTGALKSETERIAYITKTKSYDVGSQSSRQSAGDVDDSERADWLEKQALRLLSGLGVTAEIEDDGPFVVQTRSTVKNYGYD